jgi:hypothetical protein
MTSCWMLKQHAAHMPNPWAWTMNLNTKPYNSGHAYWPHALLPPTCWPWQWPSWSYTSFWQEESTWVTLVNSKIGC